MSSTSPSDVTRLLLELQAGNAAASESLMALVYAELHRLAESHMRRERADHTLQPTALVHEAFLKLVGQREATWQNRAHFFGVASQAMRRILVDYARHKQRGGKPERVTLEDDAAATPPASIDVIALDQALDKLAAIDPRQGKVVELRFFGGLEVEEVAQALGISAATVKRDWTFAKAFLQRELDAAGTSARVNDKQP